MNNEFLELSIRRKDWFESTRANNFDNGIFNLLTELYPDNAHFLYELLQNAEDSGATKVFFDLKKDSLWYSHNGRDFNFDDVRGITSIGEGTKASDINKIGKFGVGFKAVFAYTSTPFIHSGSFDFHIENLVIPFKAEPISKSHPTQMKFPFNSKIKGTEAAFTEIKKGLNEFDEGTLLFLSGIQEINVSIDDGSNYFLKRESQSETRVRITNSRLKTSSSWLRFKRDLPAQGKLFAAIAFKLGTDQKTKKKTIVPTRGKVSIFFPAEKETSNLKFHIHAPFASTVARDSIKDLDVNRELLAHLASLLGESLNEIKNEGLLNHGFISVLPIDEDGVPEFYSPLRNSLIDKFNIENLVPLDDDNFGAGVNCFRSSARLKKLVDLKMLRFLHNRDAHEDIHWIKNAQQRNSREDKFLGSLFITNFSEEEFVELISDTFGLWGSYTDLEPLDVLKFLSSVQSSWLKSFYELFYEVTERTFMSHQDLRGMRKLIRLESGEFNERNEDVFFRPDGTNSGSSFHYVDATTYKDEKPNENNKAYLFLLKLGVKSVGLEDKVELQLKLLENLNRFNKSLVIKRTNKLLKLYLRGVDLEVFRGYSFIFDDEENPRNPKKILIDKPFLNTGLKTLEDDELKCLNNCYEYLDNPGDFIDLLTSIGAHAYIPIEQCEISYKHPQYDELYEPGNTSAYTINEDYRLKDQDRLTRSDLGYSKLVWNRMISLSAGEIKKYRIAKYRRIQRSEMKTAPSSLILALIGSKWIPSVEGKFYKPVDITKQNLHPDFKFDDSNGWLSEIGFASNMINEEREYSAREEIIQEYLGISMKDAEMLKREGFSSDLVKEFIKFKRKKDASKEVRERPNLIKGLKGHEAKIDPSETAINPDLILDQQRYAEIDRDKVEDRIEKSKVEIRRRDIKAPIKPGKAESKAFLKEQYRGHCQVCGFTFRMRGDSGNYFEFFDWLSQKIGMQKTNVIEPGSSLSLCPNCHAGIKHGDFEFSILSELESLDISELDFESFQDLIDSKINKAETPSSYAFIEMDMHKLPIRLLSKEANIYYSEEHLIKFFNLLKLSGQDL